MPTRPSYIPHNAERTALQKMSPTRGLNYITKNHARRYIAAAEKSWLYPEQFIRPQKWSKIGQGLLLMPDPREIYMGGEILIGYKDGSADAFSEYDHRPWQRGYKDEERFRLESAALDRFKAEFTVMQGPNHRGSSFGFSREGSHSDSPEFFQHYIDRMNGSRRECVFNRLQPRRTIDCNRLDGRHGSRLAAARGIGA